jgi:hypothetical protein
MAIASIPGRNVPDNYYLVFDVNIQNIQILFSNQYINLMRIIIKPVRTSLLPMRTGKAKTEYNYQKVLLSGKEST